MVSLGLMFEIGLRGLDLMIGTIIALFPVMFVDSLILSRIFPPQPIPYDDGQDLFSS